MRIGVLGAGLIATYHSKSLRRAAVDIDRAGVYDPDTARAEAFALASGHRVCASEDEVLDTCDAVYVCTWTSEHPRLVLAAAARGLPVFCEKPLATGLRAAEAMTATVTAAGVTNQAGLILRRSPPPYLWARHLIAAPEAGRLMTVVVRDDQFIPTQGHYGSTWRGDRRRAGSGTLLEHSIHDVDMLRFLTCDEPVTVSAHEAFFHGIDGIEDVVTATIRFSSGALGTLASVWHDNLARPSLRRVEVFCERRHVVIEGDDWYGPVSWTDRDGSTGTLSGEALSAAAEAFATGGLNPDREFVLAARERRPATPDFETALAAHRIVDAMYRSAAAGGAPLDPRPGATAGGPTVARIPAADTLDLRRRVLRNGTVSSDPCFPQDNDPATFHLGARVGGALIGTSTWTPGTPHPGGGSAGDGVRLRGMAVDPRWQGHSVGELLVTAGLDAARALGATHVWAAARDSALRFYERLGFRVVGAAYIDTTTGLGHHDIVIDL